MKIYQVGGAVRDKLLGKAPNDCDYVVVGATPEEMLKQGFTEVGKGFPVFLHPVTKEEYALARKEIKTGDKHTDFAFVFDKGITLKEDLERRDFTCNAIAYDFENGEYIDYFGGREDIRNKILRHVNAEHFVEDPLRVLRLCRFAAQLDFEAAPETIELCRQMVGRGMLEHLTAERVWGEFLKAMKTRAFYKFVALARQIGVLKVVLPEIDALWSVPERTEYHPEGNTGEHVLNALKASAKDSALVMFALLLHDVGKLLTPKEELPSHKGHESNSRPLIYKICNRLRTPNRFRDFAVMAAEQHMRFHHIPEMRPGSLHDLAEKMTIGHICYVDEYTEVCLADFASTSSSDKKQESEKMLLAAEKLRLACRVIAEIKALDIPNFASLPKDERFKERLREYRIRILQENLQKLP